MSRQADLEKNLELRKQVHIQKVFCTSNLGTIEAIPKVLPLGNKCHGT